MGYKPDLKLANSKRISSASKRRAAIWSVLKRFIISQRLERRGSRGKRPLPHVIAMVEFLNGMGLSSPHGKQINVAYISRIIHENVKEYRSIPFGIEMFKKSFFGEFPDIIQVASIVDNDEIDAEYLVLVGSPDQDGLSQLSFIERGGGFFSGIGEFSDRKVKNSHVPFISIGRQFAFCETRPSRIFPVYGERYISFGRKSPLRDYETIINHLPLNKGIIRNLFEENDFLKIIMDFFRPPLRSDVDDFNNIKYFLEMIASENDCESEFERYLNSIDARSFD